MLICGHVKRHCCQLYIYCIVYLGLYCISQNKQAQFGISLLYLLMKLINIVVISHFKI